MTEPLTASVALKTASAASSGINTAWSLAKSLAGEEKFTNVTPEKLVEYSRSDALQGPHHGPVAANCMIRLEILLICVLQETTCSPFRKTNAKRQRFEYSVERPSSRWAPLDVYFRGRTAPVF